MVIRPLLLLLALGCLLQAAAQPRFSVTHYGNKNGLPANGITGLEWDSTNRLFWIGTEGGMVRWDGSSFATQPETEGRVLQVGPLGTAGNELYAFCEDHSLYRIRNGQIRRWKHYEDIAPPDTTAASFFQACRASLTAIVWPEWLHALGPSPDDFIAFRVNGQLWLHDRNGGHLLLDNVQHYVASFSAGGEVFFLTQEKFYRFDRKLRQLRIEQTTGWEPAQWRYVRNKGGLLPLFYQGSRLCRLRPGAGPDDWVLEPLFTGLPTDLFPRFVREVPEQGLIVLGDGINGIYALRRKSIRQLTDTSGRFASAQLVTYGQGLLPDGTVLSHSGLRYDRNGPLPGKPFPVEGSYHLFPFGPYLYFPLSARLWRFSVYRHTTERIGNLDSTTSLVFATTQGHLLAIGAGSVQQLEQDSFREVYRFPAPASGTAPLRNFSAIEEGPGRLILGSENYVRYLDLRNGSLRTVKVCAKAAIRYLWQTTYGLYVCTYGEGLFLLHRDSVYALPRDKSGYLRFAHAIVPDGHGFCYISTNNGLFKVSEAALAQAAGSGAPVCYYFLGNEAGLDQTELNGGCQPAYLRLPDGRLSFPTINGLAQLQPDSVRIAPPPGVILVRASADGRALDTLPARFDARTRLLRFDVTMPFWSSSENLYGWYRLRRSGEPLSDAPWIGFDPATQRQFSFTALRPDAYYFEIRTFNGFGPGNFVVRTVPFTIAPPWYATTRALLLWLLLAGGLVWALIYARTRQLQARGAQLEQTIRHRTGEIERQKQQLGQQLQLVSEAHDLKERLISVISHNIITPLRYIHRATTMMREDARSLDPALREKAVDSINDTSLELELLSVNLLNWIKLQHKQVQVVPEGFYFSEIAGYVKSLLGPVAKMKGQRIDVTGDDVALHHYKDALQVILYNLVLNAVTHSGGTHTTIGCVREGTVFLLWVEDDGRGIPDTLSRKLFGGEGTGATLKETDNQGKGFGFIIIKDLVRFIGGELDSDARAAGTRITVRFSETLPVTP